MSLLDFTRTPAHKSALQTHNSTGELSENTPLPPPVQAPPAQPAPEVARLTEVAGELGQTLERLEKRGQSVQQIRQMGVYLSNDPLRYHMPADPRFRPFSPLSTDALRLIGRTNDVAARCISHLKSEVTKVPLKIALKDETDKSRAGQKGLEEAKAWFSDQGGLGGIGVRRSVFEAQMLDDLLIVGACALHFNFATLGDRFDGKPAQVKAIDAATIQPLVDDHGFPIGDAAPAFRQWVQGVQVASLWRDEMIYEGLPAFARSDSPYFMSATEQAAIQVYTLMRVDEWNQAWLTEGSGYRRWLKLNPDVTPDQALAWLDIITAQTEGNLKKRHGLGIAPGEITGDESRKDQDFDGYEDKRITRICSSFGVNPASVGYHGREHKDDQEAAMDTTRDGMVADLLFWREDLYNRLLARFGWDFLVVTEDKPAKSESAQERGARQAAEIAGGVKTPNQVRAENGDDAVEGGDELLVPSTLLPLSQLVAPPPAPDGSAIDGAPDEKLKGNSRLLNEDDLRNAASDKAERVASTRVERGEGYKFGCVMVDLPTGAREAIESFVKEHGLALANSGIETQPHITVLYGLHTTSPDDVCVIYHAFEEKREEERLHALAGPLMLFRSRGKEDQADYDVLVHQVDSPDLHALNARLKELDHTSSFPDYKPHITLAYVQPGAADFLEGQPGPFTGQELTFDRLTFSSADGEAHTITCTGKVVAVQRVLEQWERKCLNRLARGQKAVCSFESDDVDGLTRTVIETGLVQVQSKNEVRELFELARMAKRGKTTSNPHNNAGSFASFWGGSGRDDVTKAHFNGKDIQVAVENAGEVEKRVQRLFGRQLTTAEWKHLGGAPDGAKVIVRPNPHDSSKVTVVVEHPHIVSWGDDKSGAVQTLQMGNNGVQADCFYEAIATQGGIKGFGARMVGYTIEAARELGMGSVSLYAAGHAGDTAFSGWKVWPRLGFDAYLPVAVRDAQRATPNLPPSVASAKTVGDLQATPEGRAFWEQHGDSFVGSYDLNLKSPGGQKSEAIRQAYFAREGIKLR